MPTLATLLASGELELGTEIRVGGVPHIGIVSLHSDWWLAVRADDEAKVLVLVKEDIE